MSLLLITITVLTFVVLLLVAALKPVTSHLSRFELKRLSGQGDEGASSDLERDNLLADVISLQRAIVAVLLVAVVLLSVSTFGWLIGIFVSLFVALEYGSIARLGFLQKLSLVVYKKFEKKLLVIIRKFPLVFRILRSIPASGDDCVVRINSREELQNIVDESQGVLSADEKNLIVHSLSFGDQLVSTVMTPKSMIDSIKNTEFLGPLTLDDLHKTGHSRLPVIKGDIDHVIGILHLNNLLSLDVKRSTTAEKAMEPKVFYIRQDQSLQHALAAFLRTKHHLFVVVNEFRETVGLLALEDIIEALLGRKIVDEFDEHDNLRLVALRNPHANNHPEKSEDV